MTPPTREEIDITLWLNNSPIYKEYCDQTPALREFGFYRKLNEGGYEFKSFCDKSASDWIAIYKDDLARLLDKYVPQKERASVQKMYPGYVSFDESEALINVAKSQKKKKKKDDDDDRQ